jgi:tetratricopeptide (TPR) repeat protein
VAGLRPGRGQSRRAGRVPWSGLLLGLAATASGLTAAVLWRARVERAGPLLTGADALVAEGERLLAAGEPIEAAARFGEAVSLAPTRVDALVGRARARARAKADPAQVQADLDRALALEPASSPALRVLADLRLARGDVRGARDALDAALAGASGAQAAAEVDAIADVRRRVAEAASVEQAAIDRADALGKALDARAALASIEAARAAAPGSAPLLAALARVAGDLGRYDEAARAADEVARLDPALALAPEAVEALRANGRAAAVAPGETPPLERWWGFRGGLWRAEGEELTGSGQGQGEFSLAALISADAPTSAEFTLSVDVSLVSGEPGAYAGLLLGGQSADDFFAVYVFFDKSVADGPGLDDYRRQHGGAWPKFVRLARFVEGRWQHRGTHPVDFADTGWVSLKVEVRGNTVTPIVAGRRSEPVRLDRPLDGRVGLIKFYDTVARFRDFRLGG